MNRFESILVGVDLSWGDHFEAEELSAPNVEAIRQALWLAQLNAASVHFLSALDLSAKAQRLIGGDEPDKPTVLDAAQNRLAQLVTNAHEQGLASDGHVVVGESWLELIRHVLRKKHDLVVVGSRRLSAIQGFMLGSTGRKLLRQCPCPVWVTRPRADRQVGSILVAHDLRPVGDLAMELGCSMAKLQRAQLHVLHAAEFPEFDYALPARVSVERQQEHRREMNEHIGTQLADADLPLPAKVHFVTDPPDAAIMSCVERHDVDLIVMGTVGRAGISGLITGNTAERLLPRIGCSLLAVKPPGFESPVSRNDD